MPFIDLETSVSHMLKCVEKLETIQGTVYLISAYSYLVIFLVATVPVVLEQVVNTKAKGLLYYKFKIWSTPHSGL